MNLNEGSAGPPGSHSRHIDASACILKRLLAATRLLAPLESEVVVVRHIVDSAAVIFDASGAALFLLDGDMFILAGTAADCATLARGLRIARTGFAMSRAAPGDAPTMVTQPEDVPDGLQHHYPALVVPLSIDKDIVGILWMRVEWPDPGAMETALQIFAAQAVAALHNARQYCLAAEADRRKDGAVATLAHELRNPLGAIINALRVLERLGASDVQAIRLRELIGRQANHLSRLVEDVLDVARLRHGKLQLQQRPLDLREIARQAVDSLQAAGRCADHKIRETFAHSPVIVNGDATRLDQIARNLLDNALKYSPPHTPINVTVDRDASTAVLSIRDEGLGIGPDLLPRLFEPFAQAEPGGAAGGLGLGLPLVRAIVEQHGGTITAHSDGVGKGSEFVVRLPLTCSLSHP